MSGHSKWSTIRHKKALEDAKKGSVFAKVARKIYLAVKQGGGGDPEKNPSFRMALEEARSVNMPGDNVRRAINRGLGVRGEGDKDKVEEVTYEGYIKGGIGIMVTVLTDNKKRTGGEIKMIFERAGGSLAGPGSVSYLRQIESAAKIKLEKEIENEVKMILEKIKNMDETVGLWTNMENYE